MRFLFVRPEVCPWLVSLPHPASFRFHLAMDTLAFGYLLPAAGRIRVFHPLETCAAGRTKEKQPGAQPDCFQIPQDHVFTM